MLDLPEGTSVRDAAATKSVTKSVRMAKRLPSESEARSVPKGAELVDPVAALRAIEQERQQEGGDEEVAWELPALSHELEEGDAQRGCGEDHYREEDVVRHQTFRAPWTRFAVHCATGAAGERIRNEKTVSTTSGTR